MNLLEVMQNDNQFLELGYALRVYKCALERYYQASQYGETIGFSEIECAKIKLADALLSILTIPTEPKLYEGKLIPRPNPLIRNPKPAPVNQKLVYLLRSENGLYKIGIASDVQKRVAKLTSSIPYKIEIIHSFSAPSAFICEKNLHEKYKELRVKGEWFRLGKKEVEEIRSIKEFV